MNYLPDHDYLGDIIGVYRELCRFSIFLDYPQIKEIHNSFIGDLDLVFIDSEAELDFKDKCSLSKRQLVEQYCLEDVVIITHDISDIPMEHARLLSLLPFIDYWVYQYYAQVCFKILDRVSHIYQLPLLSGVYQIDTMYKIWKGYSFFVDYPKVVSIAQGHFKFKDPIDEIAFYQCETKDQLKKNYNLLDYMLPVTDIKRIEQWKHILAYLAAEFEYIVDLSPTIVECTLLLDKFETYYRS